MFGNQLANSFADHVVQASVPLNVVVVFIKRRARPTSSNKTSMMQSLR